MASIIDNLRNLFDNLHRGQTRQPYHVTIQPEKVLGEAGPVTPFEPNRHYFLVRINELYLAKYREWFTEYDPMVFAVAEFNYNKSTQAIPFIVGPSIMEKYGKEIPTGMIYTNTPVAGLTPYTGGSFALAVILCRVKREDFARTLMQVVEGTASALNFSTALDSYIKVAGAVLDGVEGLLGLKDSSALFGLRNVINPDVRDVFKPTYYVLIDPDASIDPKNLWVKDKKLFYGPNQEQLTPFQEADYVLYSIAQSPERTDINLLPFYPLYERVKQEAAAGDEDSWKKAKADLLTLYQNLLLSPDLTFTQASALTGKFVEEAKQIRATAATLENLGPSTAEAPGAAKEVQDKLKEASKILDL